MSEMLHGVCVRAEIAQHMIDCHHSDIFPAKRTNASRTHQQSLGTNPQTHLLVARARKSHTKQIDYHHNITVPAIFPARPTHASRTHNKALAQSRMPEETHTQQITYHHIATKSGIFPARRTHAKHTHQQSLAKDSYTCLLVD